MIKLPFKKIIIYIIAVFMLFIIPIYTIAINSNTLKDGTEFIFEIEAYDPYDMFRGNYLYVNFKENTIPAYSNFIDANYNEPCYVTIGIRPNGFAYFKNISKERPTNTTNYYETTASYYSWSKEYSIETPTRYYMNENKSLAAEKHLNDNIDNAYVKVRVKNGKMVLVGIYVNNILIDTID